TAGRVRRVYLGINGQTVPLPRALVLSHRLGTDTAILAREVTPDSPAARAGMAGGDIVVAINGQPVRHVDDVHRQLTGVTSGDPVQVQVLRGTQPLDLTAVAEEAR